MFVSNKRVTSVIISIILHRRQSTKISSLKSIVTNNQSHVTLWSMKRRQMRHHVTRKKKISLSWKPTTTSSAEFGITNCQIFFLYVNNSSRHTHTSTEIWSVYIHAICGSLFPPQDKKETATFLSQPQVYISQWWLCFSCNCEFRSHNSDFFSRNSKFMRKKVRIVRLVAVTFLFILFHGKNRLP